ncbi:MAG: hypothetical protein AAF288_04590 [Planctomycetota bacterium]
MASPPQPTPPEAPGAADCPEVQANVRHRARAYRLTRVGQAAIQEAQQRCAAALNLEAHTATQGDPRPSPEAQAALDRAHEAFHLALEACPTPDAYAGLARAAALSARPDALDAAEHALGHALELDPARDDLIAERMALRVDAGRFDLARQDLEQLEALDSDLAQGWRQELDALTSA